ncbi:uroporphyrin-III C-methyltransferase [Pseudopedobacter saltans DSM 12145]|uniref:uroporphyrinogen-III C-methyltransferase n=1 Tax=Pseudopedobacter saltans (strain ATCC 51119 / DSM 12145 / JCM 21818 / CCUG 39354 / LMG 10337 / NBRC 100064 / NCIMB 13643) TaxID=762903 RepID=F0SDH6_PSESL|nr:uroporphyrinogen-III C-methyltransferase [Pseudopedobacter saltans]ADY53959.1 uroporphyrin-III C-methyltransferase [Pseudopedobacter saltans DSM 12145]
MGRICGKIFRFVAMTEVRPVLFVVGAGPGDPELITVKAQKVLQNANVILYDNLASRELLNLASEDCEKIYVGKRPYGEYTPQEDILGLIKSKAYEKGNVVRLKGGDPFIFGRGFEEVLYAREQGIETHFIPGISSMQALGFEDIPLTHRSVSESIWVVTGTKKDGSLSDDLKLAMQSNATVIIYMGMKKAVQIAETYSSEGRGDTPVAVVQNASLPHRKSAKGLVKDLVKLIEDNQLTHPALIVIGKVADINNLGY